MKTYYRVDEFLINFATGKSFTHSECFDMDNNQEMLSAKGKALHWYNDRLLGLAKKDGFFGNQFAWPTDKEFYKKSA